MEFEVHFLEYMTDGITLRNIASEITTRLYYGLNFATTAYHKTCLSAAANIKAL